MAISRKLLDDDERVLVSTRTHVKALLGPALVLIVIAAVAGVLAGLPTGKAAPLLQVVVWAIAFLLIARLVLRPVLRWLTTTYTVTDRRIITRSGVLSRRGHDVPLARVDDVAYEHGLDDRLLGCGTLVVASASDQGRVLLRDIPHVEHVQRTVADLLFDSTRPGGADRSRPAPHPQDR